MSRLLLDVFSGFTLTNAGPWPRVEVGLLLLISALKHIMWM